MSCVLCIGGQQKERPAAIIGGIMEFPELTKVELHCQATTKVFPQIYARIGAAQPALAAGVE